MNSTLIFSRLLRHTAIVLAVAAVAVVISYEWVDRPVAFAVHNHGTNHVKIFKWLTYPPPWAQTWSPLVFGLLVVRRAWGPLEHWQKSLLVACLSLMVANEFRTSIGDICGRYWPETWINNNPSLIGTGTYGFRFMELGSIGADIGSFPSGHSARILGFATVWWMVAPKIRWLLVIVSLPMLASLVLMNYHFVSDIIAGSVLGGIVGAYSVRLARLLPGPARHSDVAQSP